MVPAIQAAPATGQPLDSQLFSSLLPSVVNLVELATSGLDATRQIEIARQASTLRDSLNRAKEQAQKMEGADLTLEDQLEIIQILSREVERRGISTKTEKQQQQDQQ